MQVFTAFTFLLPDWLTLVTSLDCVAAVGIPYLYKVHGTSRNAWHVIAAVTLLIAGSVSPKGFLADVDEAGVCVSNAEVFDKVLSYSLMVVVALVALSTAVLVALKRKNRLKWQHNGNAVSQHFQTLLFPSRENFETFENYR